MNVGKEKWVSKNVLQNRFLRRVGLVAEIGQVLKIGFYVANEVPVLSLGSKILNSKLIFDSAMPLKIPVTHSINKKIILVENIATSNQTDRGHAYIYYKIILF